LLQCVEFSLNNSDTIHDTPDIAGEGYEYGFTWLYILETCYSILVQLKDTTRVYASGVTDGRARVRTFPPGKPHVKTGLPLSLYFGIQYSFRFQ